MAIFIVKTSWIAAMFALLKAKETIGCRTPLKINEYG